MAADPDDFIADLDCVDGNCTMSAYFAVTTAFKPRQMSTAVLMAGRQPTTSVVGS